MKSDPAGAGTGGAAAPGRPSPAERRGRFRRRFVIAAVTVAVLLGAVFVGVFPRFANYSQAWSSVQRMPAAYLVALAGAALINIAVGAWPLQAALPGLRYAPAFVVAQTSFALSNSVPAGGAIGLGVEYDMLESYRFDAAAAARAAAISSLFSVFATLVMPVLGVLALLLTGQVSWRFVLFAIVGVVVVGAAVGALALVLHGETEARRVGHVVDRILHATARRLRRGRTVDVPEDSGRLTADSSDDSGSARLTPRGDPEPSPLRPRAADVTGRLLDFRSGVIEVMKTRWAAVVGSTLLPQLTSWSIVLLALRGLENGTHETFHVTWPESLAAYSFAIIVSFIPVTVGGLGTVDAALTGLLTAFGATGGQALAVDLVWRAATFVPQVSTGALSFLWWRITRHPRAAR